MDEVSGQCEACIKKWLESGGERYALVAKARVAAAWTPAQTSYLNTHAVYLFAAGAMQLRLSF